MAHPRLQLSDVTPTPIGDGDVGLVLKPDGTFQVFNTHQNFDPANMTPIQRSQGEQIFALSVALRLPEVMLMLNNIANDPAVLESLEATNKPRTVN